MSTPEFSEDYESLEFSEDSEMSIPEFSQSDETHGEQAAGDGDPWPAYRMGRYLLWQAKEHPERSGHTQAEAHLSPRQQDEAKKQRDEYCTGAHVHERHESFQDSSSLIRRAKTMERDGPAIKRRKEEQAARKRQELREEAIRGLQDRAERRRKIAERTAKAKVTRELNKQGREEAAAEAREEGMERRRAAEAPEDDERAARARERARKKGDDPAEYEHQQLSEAGRRPATAHEMSEKKRKLQERAAKAKATREKNQAREAAAKAKREKNRAARKAAEARKEAKVREAERRYEEEEKRREQAWEDYCASNDLYGATADWSEDRQPRSTMSRIDAFGLYTLRPSELCCIKHHYEMGKRGAITLLFDEEDVQRLAFRKYAMLAGVESDGSDEGEAAVLAQGRKLWEDEGRRAGEHIDTAGLELQVRGWESSTRGPNWWRDPRVIRDLGAKKLEEMERWVPGCSQRKWKWGGKEAGGANIWFSIVSEKDYQEAHGGAIGSRQ